MVILNTDSLFFGTTLFFLFTKEQRIEPRTSCRSSSFYLVHYIDLYLVKKCMDIYVSMQTVPNFVLILIGLHWCYCLPSNNWMLIWWWWGFEWFTRMIFLNVALQYWFSVIIKIRLNGPNLSKICISK
jgi:hypothetical protein